MKPTTLVQQLSRHEQLNFLLTNRIPRRWATLFMGWFSRIRQPLVRRLSMYLWQLFSGDLRLHEARESHFESMHHCFIRRDARYQRGEEMGYFEHGSTILVFAGPGLQVHPDIKEGEEIQMGQPLLLRD